MVLTPHRLRRLRLAWQTPDQTVGAAVRDRCQAGLSGRLAAVVASVCDAVWAEVMGSSEALLRLERLELNLGAIALEQLETEAPEALAQALRQALLQALAAAHHNPSNEARLLSPGAARLERLASFLRLGVWPFQASRSSPAPAGAGSGPEPSLDPAAELALLLQDDPAGLLALLRRLASQRSALERLLLHLDAAGFGQLLALLSPADAALILAYLAELLRLHQLRPLLPLAPDPLAHSLRLLSLVVLLRDPGSPFNRRMFLEQLLRQLALEQHLAYAELLAQLRQALAASSRRQPNSGTLLSPLVELLSQELDAAASLATALAAALALARGAGAPSPSETSDADLRLLLALLHQHPDQEALQRALAPELDGPLFARLVRAIAPQQAPLVLAYVDDVVAVHRQQPLLPVAPEPLERQLRSIALQVLCHPAASAFSRRVFLEQLLRQLCQSQQLSYALLLRSLAASLARLPQPLNLHSALPVLVGELIRLEFGAAETTPSAAPTAAPASPLPTSAAPPPAAQPSAVPAAAVSPSTALPSTVPASALPASVTPTSAAPPEQLAPDSGRPSTVPGAAETAPSAAPFGPFEPSAPSPATGASPATAASQATSASSLGPAEASPALAISLGQWQAFLRDGQSAQLGPRLQEAVLADPEGFVVLLRQLLAAEPPSDTSGVADATGPAWLERLLRWLLPESLALLAASAAGDPHPPARGYALWAERRADQAGLPLAAVWRQLLPGLLASDASPPSAADLALAPLASRQLDRRAALRHWLRHGAIPAWFTVDSPIPSPPLPLAPELEPIRADPIQQEIRALGSASEFELLRLLLPLAAAGGVEAVLLALQRLRKHLPSDAFPALLERLLPWLRQPSGALAEALANASAAERPDRCLRAVAMVLCGAPLNLDSLLQPLPPSPSQSQPQSQSQSQSALPEVAGAGAVDPVAAPLQPVAPAPLAASLPAAPLPAAAAPPTATPPTSTQSQSPTQTQTPSSPPTPTPQSPSPSLPPSLPPSPSTTQPPATPAALLAPPDPAARERLFAWLRGEGSEAPEQQPSLLRLFAQLADQADPELLILLREGLVEAAHRQRWSRLLPEALLGRVVLLLQPGRGSLLLDLQSLLAVAARAEPTPVPGPNAAAEPGAGAGLGVGAGPGAGAAPTGLNGEPLLALLAVPEPLPSRAIAQRLLAQHSPSSSAAEPSRLRRHARQLAADAGALHLLAALEPNLAPPPPAPPRQPPEPWRFPEPDAPPTEPLYIANAGLVLLHPFLPQLFERLELLPTAAADNTGEDPSTEGKASVGIAGLEARSRAVHLLQWLVDGRLDRPETELSLNKLLAGLDLSAPIRPSYDASDDDLAVATGLLEAVIQHWPPLANTSLDGLRETFLQREGRLDPPSSDANHWTLHVQRRTVDVLLNQLPWSFTLIKHRWLPLPLHVHW